MKDFNDFTSFFLRGHAVSGAIAIDLKDLGHDLFTARTLGVFGIDAIVLLGRTFSSKLVHLVKYDSLGGDDHPTKIGRSVLDHFKVAWVVVRVEDGISHNRRVFFLAISRLL